MSTQAAQDENCRLLFMAVIARASEDLKHYNVRVQQEAYDWLMSDELSAEDAKDRATTFECAGVDLDAVREHVISVLPARPVYANSIRERSHCSRGHALTPDNRYLNSAADYQYYTCRTCSREKHQRRKAQGAK